MSLVVEADPQQKRVVPSDAGLATTAGSLRGEERDSCLHFSSDRGNTCTISFVEEEEVIQPTDKESAGTQDQAESDGEHQMERASVDAWDEDEEFCSLIMDDTPTWPSTPMVAQIWAGGAKLMMVVGIARFQPRFPTAKQIEEYLSGVSGVVPRTVLARAFVREALEWAVDEYSIHRDMEKAARVAEVRMLEYQHRLRTSEGRTPPVTKSERKFLCIQAQQTLIDTGAEVSVMDLRLARQLALNLQPVDSARGPLAIRGFQASQSPMEVVALAEAWVLLGDQLLEAQFCIMGYAEHEAVVAPLILGFDFLARHQLSLSPTKAGGYALHRGTLLETAHPQSKRSVLAQTEEVWPSHPIFLERHTPPLEGFEKLDPQLQLPDFQYPQYWDDARVDVDQLRPTTLHMLTAYHPPKITPTRPGGTPPPIDRPNLAEVVEALEAGPPWASRITEGAALHIRD